MTVILSSSGRVKSGRYVDFLSQASESSKLYQRLGTKAPRLLTAGLAGEAFGEWTFNVEFDDLRSFGTTMDKYQADPEAQAFLMGLHEENSPSTVERVNVMMDVPIRESKGGKGNLVAVFASKPQPGALERSLDLAARAGAVAERHGALDARIYSLMASGSGTGVYLSLWEFEDMTGYANVIASFQTDKEGEAIVAEASSSNSPSVTLFEGVFNQIPV